MNKRRLLDFYPTPAWATEILLDEVGPTGVILEPCAGDGRISKVLERANLSVITNDIDPHMEADAHSDALDAGAWHWSRDFEWVISNPPFAIADRLVPLAVEHAHRGVAMLLRISWLEPTIARGQWLAEHPPTRLLILPRISFDGSGKTDNVTCAWFIWDRYWHNGQQIRIVPRRAPQEPLFAPAASTRSRYAGGPLRDAPYTAGDEPSAREVGL